MGSEQFSLEVVSPERLCRASKLPNSTKNAEWDAHNDSHCESRIC